MIDIPDPFISTICIKYHCHCTHCSRMSPLAATHSYPSGSVIFGQQAPSFYSEVWLSSCTMWSLQWLLVVTWQKDNTCVNWCILFSISHKSHACWVHDSIETSVTMKGITVVLAVSPCNFLWIWVLSFQILIPSSHEQPRILMPLEVYAKEKPKAINIVLK